MCLQSNCFPENVSLKWSFLPLGLAELITPISLSGYPSVSLFIHRSRFRFFQNSHFLCLSPSHIPCLLLEDNWKFYSILFLIMTAHFCSSLSSVSFPCQLYFAVNLLLFPSFFTFSLQILHLFLSSIISCPRLFFFFVCLSHLVMAEELKGSVPPLPWKCRLVHFFFHSWKRKCDTLPFGTLLFLNMMTAVVYGSLVTCFSHSQVWWQSLIWAPIKNQRLSK